MASQLAGAVARWSQESGLPLALFPDADQLDLSFGPDANHLRTPVGSARLESWERRFGFALPEPLKAWLRISDGFYGSSGPLIHPLSAIGPMIPFARTPGLVIQPESWFELGNPNLETVCLDLAYRWPEGDNPLFTSGDDERRSPPRIIASSFADWFVRLLNRGGREYWFEPGFHALGDPWQEHCRQVPRPFLPDRLRRLLARVRPMMARGLDDRVIATGLGLSRGDVEAIHRHLQHISEDVATMRTESGR